MVAEDRLARLLKYELESVSHTLQLRGDDEDYSKKNQQQTGIKTTAGLHNTVIGS